jgi:hypothetical protein
MLCPLLGYNPAIDMRDDAPLPDRHSVRLPHFDYSQAAGYFLTICTHNHEPLFGDAVLEEVVLNAFGNMVRACWLDIPHHFARARLGPYVIIRLNPARRAMDAENGDT